MYELVCAVFAGSVSLGIGGGIIAIVASVAVGGLLLLARARNKIESVIASGASEVPELI